jgi:hypothetical protein
MGLRLMWFCVRDQHRAEHAEEHRGWRHGDNEGGRQGRDAER